MSYEPLAIEVSTSVNAGDRFSFFRPLFGAIGRSIVNFAIYTEGLVAYIQGIYHAMMTKYRSASSRSEKSSVDSAINEVLLQEYATRYPSSCDHEAERVLMITLDSVSNTVSNANNINERKLKELALKQSLQEQSRQLLACWQDSNDPEVQKLLATKQSQFILTLALLPDSQHLDFSGFSFAEIDQSRAFRVFLKTLLDCNPHITRICVHSDDEPFIQPAITPILLMHQQVFVAREILADDLSPQSVDVKQQIQTFYGKAAQKIIIAHHRETAKHLSYLDGVMHQSTSYKKSRTGAVENSQEFSRNNFFSWPFAKIPESPVWDYLRQGVTAISLYLKESLKVINGLRFPVNSSSNKPHAVVDSTQPLLPQYTVEELEKMYTFVDQTQPRLPQYTEEVERILALWDEWLAIKSNPKMSVAKKEAHKDRIFSAIFNKGLEEKLKVFSEERALACEKQKSKFTHVDQCSGQPDFQPLYEKASRIMTDDDVVAWKEKNKTNTSATERILTDTVCLMECNQRANAIFSAQLAKNDELTLEITERRERLSKKMAAYEALLASEKPCIPYSNSLPSISTTAIFVDNPPRSLSFGDKSVGQALVSVQYDAVNTSLVACQSLNPITLRA